MTVTEFRSPRNTRSLKQVFQRFRGFVKEEGTATGSYLYYVKGWDYPGMIRTFSEGIQKCRKEHVPVVFHVDEMVQPLGHSTSGSHERYKSAERLKWEEEHDPLIKMREWILANHIAHEA